MAKESGKKSFLDFFKMKELDEDEFDDDYLTMMMTTMMMMTIILQ